MSFIWLSETTEADSRLPRFWLMVFLDVCEMMRLSHRSSWRSRVTYSTELVSCFLVSEAPKYSSQKLSVLLINRFPECPRAILPRPLSHSLKGSDCRFSVLIFQVCLLLLWWLSESDSHLLCLYCTNVGFYSKSAVLDLNWDDLLTNLLCYCTSIADCFEPWLWIHCSDLFCLTWLLFLKVLL